MPTSIMSQNATSLSLAHYPQHTIRRAVATARPMSVHRQPAPLPAWHASAFLGKALVTPEHKSSRTAPLSRDALVCRAISGQEIQQVIGTVVSLGLPIVMIGSFIMLLRDSARAQAAVNSSRGNADSPFNFGKFRGNAEPKKSEENKPSVTFDDIAGIDEAKRELQDIVDFLKNPDKYTKMGASICKGCLLDGAPGTGKTLLAKAVAGEADVPFFSAKGSEFDEIFVGVGASRVRDLFAKAKASAPCIVFIDEIDALGRKRGGGMMGGDNGQTINQLLTEMDGFEKDTGVIVLAATNRSDVLDSALLRPGRFDRHVIVNMPDVNGRKAILEVHARNKKFEEGVSLQNVAQRSVGFSGAQLRALLNDAAILAVTRKHATITTADLDDAYDRTVAGIERPDAATSQRKRRLVAYHEAGHAVMSAVVGEYDKCQSVSILPRNRAAGLTWFTPDPERLDDGILTRGYLSNRNVVALGGRVAEELIFGMDQVTTGAGADLREVRNNAKRMVLDFGWGKDLAPMAALNADESNAFGGGYQASEAYRQKVDSAIEFEVQNAVNRARSLMRTHQGKLHAVAEALLAKEKLTGDEFTEIMNAK